LVLSCGVIVMSWEGPDHLVPGLGCRKKPTLLRIGGEGKVMNPDFTVRRKGSVVHITGR